MYYFLKDANFNLENYEFDVEVNPKFTKKEQIFLKEFIDNYSSEKEYSMLNINNLPLKDDDIKKTIQLYILALV